MTVSEKINCCSARPNGGAAGRSVRSAFTLIELLLVISVIAVLSSLAIGVMASANEDARVSATRARIQLIQSALEIELEDYEVRRSPVSLDQVRFLADAAFGSVVSGNPSRLNVKNMKRMIIADLIRSEMPDGSVAVGSFPSPDLNQMFIDAGVSQNDINAAFRDPANVSRWNNNSLSNSELLYLILSGLDFNGTNVIDSLGSSAVGDTDGDSQLEIIDGFGDPITFEFHQRNFEEMTDTDGNRIWSQDSNSPMAMETFAAVKPVLPSDIRVFLTSEKLLEIDGDPVDLERPVIP